MARAGRRQVGVVAAAGVLLVATGCVGATSRADFTAEIRARGGGVTAALPAEVLDAVADDLGVDLAGLTVRSVTINPEANTARVEVRDPAVPANVDSYVWHNDSLDEPEPVRLSAGDDLDAAVFSPASVAFDDIEVMTDRALDEFGEPDGYVTTINVHRLQEQVTIAMSLQSARADGTARFTAAGELMSVERR